jgi:hypothetical protein
VCMFGAIRVCGYPDSWFEMCIILERNIGGNALIVVLGIGRECIVAVSLYV